MSLHAILVLAFLLFGMGAFGLLLRKNILVIFMCLELMLSSVSLVLVAFSSYNNNLDGALFVFFLITLAAAEVALGLAILVRLFRLRQSIKSDSFHNLQF